MRNQVIDSFVAGSVLVLSVSCGGGRGGGKVQPSDRTDAGGSPFFSDTSIVVPVEVECGAELEGTTQICFAGAESQIGVGECRSGVRTCTAGYWGPCLGMVAPTPEYCDGRDNDCNGLADEGVLSPCGNCDPFCGKKTSGSETEDPLAPTDANSQNVVQTPEGWLTLTATSINLNVIWIANSAEGTVSKLDTNTGYEMGRYSPCGDPSRTAVDKYGNGWIGCRGGNAVTKIINFEGECPDKNQNGTIETSRDLNGDHKITPDEMVPGTADECVLWLTPVGDLARAMGVDYEQHGWTGLWNSQQLQRFDKATGAVLQTIGIPVNPYGLVIAKDGLIWVSGRGGSKLVSANPLTGAVNTFVPPGGYDPYGIALDEFGRVWTANIGSGGNGTWMYDPANGAWAWIALPARPRGLVANGNGRVFVACDESNQVAVVDMKTMSHFQSITSLGLFPLGMAVDSSGFVWAVNQNTGSVTKINSFSLEPVGDYPVGAGPYTYSDMTGTAFFDAVPPGWYRHRFEAAQVSGLTGLKAMNNAFWETLYIDFVAPPGAFIKFRVRTGETDAELGAALWTPLVGPFPDQQFPVDLATILDEKGHLLEVETWLYPSDEGDMPLLKGFDVKYQHVP